MAESGPLNSVRAGIFVVTTVALFLTVTFVLLKVNLFGTQHTYAIDFTTADGVSGLNQGSDVRVGGVIAGEVVSLTPQIDHGLNQLKGIRVNIELSSVVPLYWSADKPQSSAKVIRVPSLLGNSASINFISVGDPGAAEVPVGGAIPAIEGSGMLASLVGPENAERAKQIIADLAGTVAWFHDTLPKEYTANISPMLTNLNTTIAAFKGDYETWRKPIGDTLTSTSGFTGRADHLLQENEPRINRFMDDAVITLANARNMSEDLKTKGVPALQKLLDRGATAADSLAISLQEVQDALIYDLPNLATFLEDSRQVASQLKLAAIEVRHSPWKLLYQPKPGEMAHENLYDAARSFAMATEDLRVAGESLQQAVQAMPGRLEKDEAFRKQVQSEVVDAMSRYDQAQRRLYDVLNAPASQGGEAK